MRTLLSYRDARLLLAGQSLSAFGDWAMLIVLAVWMKSLTGSSALAGLTFFVFAAGSLLAPLGGLLADRVRRRPLMIVSDCVLGAFVLVLLLVHDRSDAWLIYAVAFAVRGRRNRLLPRPRGAAQDHAAGGAARGRERRAHGHAGRPADHRAARGRRALHGARRERGRGARLRHLRGVRLLPLAHARAWRRSPRRRSTTSSAR